jgi:hypothetical protein
MLTGKGPGLQVVQWGAEMLHTLCRVGVCIGTCSSTSQCRMMFCSVGVCTELGGSVDDVGHLKQHVVLLLLSLCMAVAHCHTRSATGSNILTMQAATAGCWFLM